MNIGIVGAGLLGRLIAWQLLEKGHHVTLFDKDGGKGELSAGIVAAAMLAPLTELLDAEPVVYTQGLAGLDVWRSWAENLEQSTGQSIDLQINGSMVVAHRNDMGDYQRFIQRLRAEPVVDDDKIHYLEKEDILLKQAELADKFDHACYLETEGVLDNHKLYIALKTRIEALGGQFVARKHIESLEDDCLKDFDRILDCRGFGIKADESSLQKSLRGVRGEVMRVRAPEVNLTMPVRLMHPRYKLYISPRENHEYVIGATQIESESEHPITVRSSMELLSALYSVHTGFSEAEVIEQMARCRPAFDDNLPSIKLEGNRLAVNGMYRHGYLLAPSVVNEVLYQLTHESDLRWEDIVSSEHKEVGAA